MGGRNDARATLVCVLKCCVKAAAAAQARSGCRADTAAYQQSTSRSFSPSRSIPITRRPTEAALPSSANKEDPRALHRKRARAGADDVARESERREGAHRSPEALPSQRQRQHQRRTAGDDQCPRFLVSTSGARFEPPGPPCNRAHRLSGQRVRRPDLHLRSAFTKGWKTPSLLGGTASRPSCRHRRNRPLWLLRRRAAAPGRDEWRRMQHAGAAGVNAQQVGRPHFVDRSERTEHGGDEIAPRPCGVSRVCSSDGPGLLRTHTASTNVRSRCAVRRPPMFWPNCAKNGVPNGIRTRVAAVKGRCPRPLDDRD